MGPKRAQTAPPIRRTYSQLALKCRLEQAMKTNRELKYVNQTLNQRNEKLKTALTSFSTKADAALQADRDGADAMLLKAQELRDQAQSDSD